MRTLKLSELQLDVMRALWAAGEATVAAVHAALQERRKLAFTTVATLLKRLEGRGLVSHRTTGRQFVYRPEVTEDAVRQSMVGELHDRWFEGDLASFVCHLLAENRVSRRDLERIRRLVEDREKELRGGRRG